jgi:ribosomal protein L40E
MADSTMDNLAASADLEADEGRASADVEVCPNCGAERTDASVMWCRKCGYHPTLDCVIDLVGDDLDQEPAAAAETPAKPSATEGLAILCRTVPP